MNPLWPLSVGLPAAILIEFASPIGSPALSEFEVTSRTIVATLLALGILEHFFLVIPWPTSWLWGRRPASTPGDALADPVAAKPF
jgi:putative photosynthetic complex assembly protein 2